MVRGNLIGHCCEVFVGIVVVLAMDTACSRCRPANDTLATGLETRTMVWEGSIQQTGQVKRSGGFDYHSL